MPAYRIAICSQRVFRHIQESKLIRAQATFGKTYAGFPNLVFWPF